jgi:hypothetical protein
MVELRLVSFDMGGTLIVFITKIMFGMRRFLNYTLEKEA